MLMTRLKFLALALLSVGFTACLETTAPPSYNTVVNTTYEPSLGVDLANSTKTDAGVYYRDITVGTGPIITALQDSYMYYHGYLSNGVQFDSVKAPGPPAHFVTGQGTLIPGFEIGLNGMRVGGRRQIIVPPDLAYGLSDVKDSAGNVVIPGNSVLVFTVDLTDASGGSGSTP
jgi:FKBP-type peptidyl-prolyl cis-trans isomerase FkpA